MFLIFASFLILSSRVVCEDIEVFSSPSDDSRDKVIKLSEPLVPGKSRTQETAAVVDRRD